MALEPKKVTGGAFGRFLAANRADLTKQCAGKPVTAVVKLASTNFKALAAPETAKYQAEYEKAKKQYDTDLAAFLAAGGEKKAVKRKGDKLDKKGKKAKKDADAPKKPAGGGYGCYVAQNRAAFMKECAGQPITAVSKIAGARWKALSAEEKKPFEEEYLTKKAAYAKAMESYVPPAKPEEEEGGEKKTFLQTTKEKIQASKEAKEQVKSEAKEAKESAKQAKVDAKQAKKGSKLLKSTAKKVKAMPKKPVGPELFPNVALKAEKAGLTDTLLKLLARDDIKDCGKTQLQMLSALEENKGLLHPTKRALLGC